MRDTEVLGCFRPSCAEAYVLPGTRLVEAAAEAGIVLEIPCGGEGLCGKCRVIVASGAGAAAIACLNLLVVMGAQRKNIWVCDIDGVVHEGRNTLMDRWKAVYAQKTDKRKLAEVIGGADIFLGLSAPNVLTPDMVKAMADKPLVMAQIEIQQPDGKSLHVVTDATWKTHPSPLSPIGNWAAPGYGGECYDARREVDGWNTA